MVVQAVRKFLFEGRRATGCGWFRVLGVGLAWADTDQHGELLSRRYVGKHGWQDRRRLEIGAWRIALTTRWNP